MLLSAATYVVLGTFIFSLLTVHIIACMQAYAHEVLGSSTVHERVFTLARKDLIIRRTEEKIVTLNYFLLTQCFY